MSSDTRNVIDLIRKFFVDMRLQIVSFTAQNKAAISLLSHCETNPPPPSKYKGWKGFVNSCFFLVYIHLSVYNTNNLHMFVFLVV